MADEDEKALRLAASLPLEERIQQKLWKARKDAYDFMLAELGKAGTALPAYAPMLSTIVSDSNQGAQDVACDVALAFLSKCSDETAGKCAPGVSSSLVAKAFNSRPAIVKKAGDIMLLLVEHGCASDVIAALTSAYTHKVPKVALATLEVTFSCVQQFGAAVVPVKAVMPALAKVFDARDQKAREKAKEIVVEIARWVGAAPVRQTIVEKMRDTQKAEVEGWLADLPRGKPSPERLTREEQARRAAAPPPPAEDASAPAASAAAPGARPPAVDVLGADDDAYDFADPVDVVAQLPKTFWAQVEDAKWSIRRDALATLRRLAETPRAQSSSWHDVAGALKKVLGKDTNVACVGEAAACVAALAKSVRKPFAQFAKGTFLALCFDKFKDKTTNVTAQSMSAVAAMHRYCFRLAEVDDVVKAALAAASPKVRELTLTWLGECAAAEGKADAAKVHASLLPTVAALAGDAVPATRDAAVAALAAFATRAGGLAAIEKYLDKLDERRKQQLRDLVTGPAGSPCDSVATSKAAPSLTSSPSRRPTTAAARSIPAPSPARRPATAAAAARPKPGAKAASAAPKASVEAEDEASLQSAAMSKDAAKEALGEMFGEGVAAQLGDAVWKVRVEGMEAVLASLPTLDLAACASKTAQALAQLPGWKDTNFQVLSKMCDAYRVLADQAPAFSKKDAFAGLAGMVDKISDTKVKPAADAALLTMAEVVSLQFVSEQVHKRAAAHKNPKVLSESLLWQAGALELFGLQAANVKALIAWLKADLANTNAAVRQAATALSVVMFRALGDRLGDMLKADVKPALMTTLQDQWKDATDPPAPPTRFERAKAALLAEGGASGKRPPARRPAAAGASAAVQQREEEAPSQGDDLLPREDISPLITDELVAQLGDSNWKERKAGLDSVDSILTGAGDRIEPTVGDLMAALKPRMADTNRNLAAQAINLCARLAAAMGRPFERSGRVVCAPLLVNMSDNKPVVRAAVQAFIQAFISACGFEALADTLVSSLMLPKCASVGKTCALEAVAAAISGDACKLSKGDRAGIVRAAAIGLEDKAIEARKAATACVARLCALSTPRDVLAAASGLSDAQRMLVADVVSASSPDDAASTAPAASARPPSPAKPAPRRPATAAAAAPRPATAAASLRPTSSLPRGATMSRPPTPGDDAADDAPLLSMSAVDKETRRVPMRSAKFETRVGEEGVVRTLLADIAAPHLHKLMFADDFKHHCTAADKLQAAVSTQLDEMTASLDLLLRWAVLRLCDEKLQSLLRVQSFLLHLMTALRDAGYAATDNEAAVLLPCLCEKSGHNQERARQAYRELLAAFRLLYNPHRMAVFLMEGMDCKNNKSRADCCDEMAAMLRAYGIDILYKGPRSKRTCNALRQLATLTSERDGALRQAALGALMVVYEREGGPTLWSLLGDSLSLQQKDMILERQKYSDKELAKRGLVAGQSAQAGSSERTSDAVSERPPTWASTQSNAAGRLAAPSDAAATAKAASQKIALPQQQPPKAAAPDAVPTFVQRGLHAQQPPAPRPVEAALDSTAAAAPPATPMPGVAVSPAIAPLLSPAEHQAQWRRGFRELKGGDEEMVIEGIKLIFYELMEFNKGALDAETSSVITHSVDRLVLELTKRSGRTFAQALEFSANAKNKNPARGIRYLLNCLMQVYNGKDLSLQVAREATTLLIAEILTQLTNHDAIDSIPAGNELLRVLNVLMCKVLDNSNKNHLFAALLATMSSVPDAIASQPPAVQQLFLELVVKCLIKLTKPLFQYMDELDVEDLILCLHKYFDSLGVDEIRRRSAINDKPLRMAKTVLHELCKIKGAAILDHCRDVPRVDERGASPILLAYIDVNLKTLQDVGLLSGPLPQGHVNPEEGSMARPLPRTPPTRSPTQPPLERQPSIPMQSRSAPRSALRQIEPTLDEPEEASTPPSLPRRDAATAPAALPTPSPRPRDVRAPPAADEPAADVFAAPPAALRPVLQSSNSQNKNTLHAAVPDDLKPQVHEIFKKIGSQSTTMPGLEALFDLLQEYPNLPIDTLLAATSPAFRAYIQKGLDKVRRRRIAGAAKMAERTSGGLGSSQGRGGFGDVAHLRERLEKLAQTMPSSVQE